jgi:hypothetical protein
VNIRKDGRSTCSGRIFAQEDKQRREVRERYALVDSPRLRVFFLLIPAETQLSQMMMAFFAVACSFLKIRAISPRGTSCFFGANSQSGLSP